MRYRYRPSKPAAVFTALVGTGMLIFGLTTFHRFGGFMVLWCVALVGIVGMNLWAAFSPRGSLYTVERTDDDDPHRPAPSGGDRYR